MTLIVSMICCAAQGPTVESLAQNEETDGRASGSGAEADQPESQGKSNRPEKPVKAERVPPALNSSRSTEEIDNMAALLAGKSLDKVHLLFHLLVACYFHILQLFCWQLMPLSPVRCSYNQTPATRVFGAPCVSC